MKSFLTILPVLLGFAVFSARAETPASVFKGAGDVTLGGYKAREPKSLEEIPEPVRAALEKHLRKRLGDDFYAKLEFSGGQVVDMEEFHRREKHWKDYQWEVFTYRLAFAVKQPEKGIEYHAVIELRKDGGVIKEIDLPQVAEHPERGKFVPLAEALKAAATGGIDPTNAGASMEYLPDGDRVVFRIEQYMGKTGSEHHIKSARVDAHTGKLIDVSDLTADG